MVDHSPIFEQEWWYQAATDGKWQQAEFSNGRNLTARLVFSKRCARNTTVIGMPALARVMQPRIDLGPNKPRDSLSSYVQALNGLSEVLPEFDRFEYTLPPESELDLAYCLAGYCVTVSYTFRSDPGGRHDPWTEMDQKVRYNIRSGSKRLRVERHDNIDRYIELSSHFIKNRAFSDPVDYDALRRIWDACQRRRQAAIFSCVDDGHHDLAGAILLWDDRFLYYWLNCRNPASSDYAANSVLIWNAIEFARAAGLVFDIDGYATPNAGMFLSRFGLLPQRRFNVSMTSSAARLKSAVSSHLVEMVGPRVRKQLLTVRNAVYPSAHHGRAGGTTKSRSTTRPA